MLQPQHALYFFMSSNHNLRNEIWPKTGKLKKGLIILAIVIVVTTGATLLQEQTGRELSSRVYFPVALCCAAIWFYPGKKTGSSNNRP